MNRQLRYSDRPQPVERWSERIATAIACMAIGFALMWLVIR